MPSIAACLVSFSDMPPTIPRLRLIPHLPADLLALIDGEDAYEACTGRRATGLHDFFVPGD
jgi:hypothetical protein